MAYGSRSLSQSLHLAEFACVLPFGGIAPDARFFTVLTQNGEYVKNISKKFLTIRNQQRNSVHTPVSICHSSNEPQA